ncbi:GNAT family N-acetyltransferase [Streptomyces stramineus]|uniref:GNAT family N-acetyltransferase n=1 Tax=Streptomyces stramineus TaxID=173861 RepID=A0ABN1AI13_9ACTN
MSTITTRPLGPEDWRLYRTVRLTALADAPEAFGATWADESTFPEEKWKDRLGRRNSFVAVRDGEACGLVGVVPLDSRVAGLVSMWVAPGARSQGVGGLLVARALEWAADNGFPEVRLWVSEGNDRAERLYSRQGFRRTGEVQLIRDGEDAEEFAMSRHAGP